MSSPFQIFRKYQKTLLVVAGVDLIFVYVNGDSLMQRVGSAAQGQQSTSGSAPTDIAVKWDGGKFTNHELGNLVFRRRVVKGFLEQLFQLGRQLALEAGADPQQLPQGAATPSVLSAQGLDDEILALNQSLPSTGC